MAGTHLNSNKEASNEFRLTWLIKELLEVGRPVGSSSTMVSNMVTRTNAIEKWDRNQDNVMHV
jgi:hypothetical protein